MTDDGKTQISCLKGRPGVRRQTKLFDYFVGASDDHGRDRDAQCLCRLGIEGEFEHRRLDHREVGGLFAAENASHVGADLAIHSCEARTVAD